MPIAAVPRYMQENDPEFYLSSPPGHRFLLYLPAWGENQESDQIDWRMADRVPKIDKKTGQQKTGKSSPEWDDLPNGQFACMIVSCKTPKSDAERPRRRKPKADSGLKTWHIVMNSLLARQRAAFASQPRQGMVMEAVSIAPFATGLGNEHPLENGFAFLNPYGLPYLPGSGVKGVLRQAAKELASGAWGDPTGWSGAEDPMYTIPIGREAIRLSMIDVLFGLESQEGSQQHVRGALSFWDVIPQITGDSLMVEIMTPHQSHYYQQKLERRSGESTSPHDSGQPNPISFLTVPPGSQFTFHVVCDVQHLKRLTKDKMSNAPDLLAEGETHWKTLLETSFHHTFAWLGFGAKTAGGYGAMKPAVAFGKGAQPDERSTTIEAEAPAEPIEPRTTQASPAQTTETVWESSLVTYSKGGGGIVTVQSTQGKAEARGPSAQAFLQALSPEQRQRLEKKGQLKHVAIVVRIEGNMRIPVRPTS